MMYLLSLVAEAAGLVGASGPGEADDGRLVEDGQRGSELTHGGCEEGRDRVWVG
jgi:hypothetical protein